MTDFEKALYFSKKSDYEKAIICFRKCARDGSTEAMNNLASIYLQQYNDYNQAIYWYKQAMEYGNTRAFNNLGVLYEMTKDYDKAIKLFLAVAKKEPRAYCNLGSLYYNSLKDTEKAKKYYELAAKEGITDAMCSLGTLLQLKGQEAEAKEWFEKAANEHNNKAMQLLGDLYYRSKFKDLTEAEYWWREAVENGSVDALVSLGNFYRIEKKDYVKSFDYLEKAANIGNPIAMDSIGHLYESVLKKNSMALKWYRQAIEENYVPAMVSLGYFYFNQSEYYDFNTSRSWFTKAYQSNNLEGLVGLGYIFFFDENNKNTIKAIDYLGIAARKGALSAYKLMGDIYLIDVNSTDYDKALENYEAALPIDYNGDIYYKMSQVYKKTLNQGKFLEYICKAADRDSKEALFEYGKLLCNSSFVRYNYLSGIQSIQEASHLGYTPATKYLALKYNDKRSQVYDPEKARFYYRTLIDQLVRESHDFDTPQEIDDLSTEQLISCTIALIENIKID